MVGQQTLDLYVEVRVLQPQPELWPFYAAPTYPLGKAQRVCCYIEIRSMTLPRYLPLSEAAARLGWTEARLRALVEQGKMKAALINGEMVVNEESVERRTPIPSSISKEELPEYRKYLHLKGVPIWLRKAENDYGIPLSTLQRWVKRGIIAIIGQESNRLLIDEADVAYCAEIYRTYSGRVRGRRLFNSTGTLYKPKTGPLTMKKTTTS